ncbi:cell envelope integrity protein CreD [Sphingomonas oligophenolica]|nr:cell envelope integrity protein CreD [Sphingomonas oligophenolica]
MPLTTTKFAHGIGMLILFAALAGIMYLTRNLDWSGLLAMPPTT